MNDALVSVVVAVYNTKQVFLDEAIKSILNQTYQNFELIIVDDASNSDLFLGQLYKDSRIKIIKNEINKGPSYSRNVGIKKAVGKYIALMDSDDISDSRRLEKQLDFLEANKDYVACSSWYKEFGARDREIKIAIDDFEYYRCSLFFKNNPPLNCSALMARSEVLKTILFDEKIRFAEDWKLWVIMSEYGKIYNIKEILSYYRIHDQGLTSQHKHGIKINESNGAVGARAYVMNKITLELSETENCALFLTKKCKKIKPKIMYGALSKLRMVNNKCNYYDQESLDKKCNEVWQNYVKLIWNPAFLLSGFFLKNNKILKIKFSQISSRFKRIFTKK